MKFRSLLFLGGLAILLSAAACTKKSNTNTNTTPYSTVNQGSVQNVNTTSVDNTFATNTNTAATTGVTVTLTTSGPQLNPLTVAKGTTVTFVNNDSTAHWIVSKPHPTHTDLPGFDLGAIAPGSAKQYTFVKVGRWGYHDHLDAANTAFFGVVIVTK